MKLYIKDESEIESSERDLNSRKKSVKSKSKTLAEHIAKCVIYGNTPGSYNFWIESEISARLEEIVKVDLKTVSFKKLRSFYRESVFDEIKNESDIKKIFKLVYTKDVKTGKLSPFNMRSSELINLIKTCYDDMSNVCSDCLAAGNVHQTAQSEFSNIVHGVMDKYCLNINRPWLQI